MKDEIEQEHREELERVERERQRPRWPSARPRRRTSATLTLWLHVCDGAYIVTQGRYVGCSNHTSKRTCDNARLMKADEIEGRVLGALRKHLLSPERVEAYREEREERAMAHAKEGSAIEKELAQCTRTLATMMQKMVDGFEVTKDEYNAVARRWREFEEKLPLAEKATITVMHAAAAKRYRQKVEEIQAALTKGAAGHEAVALVAGAFVECRARRGEGRG